MVDLDVPTDAHQRCGVFPTSPDEHYGSSGHAGGIAYSSKDAARCPQKSKITDFATTSRPRTLLSEQLLSSTHGGIADALHLLGSFSRQSSVRERCIRILMTLQSCGLGAFTSDPRTPRQTDLVRYL